MNYEEIQSIEHAFQLAQEMYERFESHDLKMLEQWQIVYVKEFTVFQLIRAANSCDRFIILELIDKINNPIDSKKVKLYG